MNKNPKYLSLFVFIILAGGLLRLQHLDRRPMHNDESVNAVKFGILLEQGTFIYDKEEYHGPLLYYMTLVPAWVSGITRYQDLTEFHLRIVTVLAGIALLLLAQLLVDFIDRDQLLATTFIAAISPAMVFYSRYYIHELLLVLCTYACIMAAFLYFDNGKKKWLIAAGIMLGAMHAIKETFILSAAALIFAMVLHRILWKHRSNATVKIIRTITWQNILVFVGFAILASVVFYSSFFKNPQGILDSVGAYGNYLSRAGGNEIHRHPWYYYITILTWNRGPGYIIWTELPVVIMSIYGMIIAFRKIETRKSDRFFRFIALFTLILLLFYSIIPYKTPWNILTFYYGMIWMAGYGTVHLFAHMKNSTLKIFVSICLIASAIYLALQVVVTNTKYPAESTNPYVYAHTSMEIYHIINRIEEVAAIHPEGKEMYIQVISPDHDYWPLPWYLRKYRNVGWWDHVDAGTPLAPLVISSPVLEEELIDKMYRLPEPGQRYLYVPLFDGGTELRPGVGMNGYIRQDIRGLKEVK